MGFFDSLRDYLFGTKEKAKKSPRFTPQGMEAYDQYFEGGGIGQDPLFQKGTDFLQSLFDGDMSAFQGPLMQQFEQDIIPGISEQFAGLQSGAGSGLNQALARASENLGTQLGAQRAGLMTQMLPQALSYAQAPGQEQRQMLQIDPYDRYIQESSPGIFGQFASGIMPGVGRTLEKGFGGPVSRLLERQATRYIG